jgi:hypothetical protein
MKKIDNPKIDHDGPPEVVLRGLVASGSQHHDTGGSSWFAI